MSNGAREFCTIDDDGEVSDADLHEAFLDNPAAEAAAIRATRDRLIAAGEDPAVIDQLFPLPPDPAPGA